MFITDMLEKLEAQINVYWFHQSAKQEREVSFLQIGSLITGINCHLRYGIAKNCRILKSCMTNTDMYTTSIVYSLLSSLATILIVSIVCCRRTISIVCTLSCLLTPYNYDCKLTVLIVATLQFQFYILFAIFTILIVFQFRSLCYVLLPLYNFDYLLFLTTGHDTCFCLFGP